MQQKVWVIGDQEAEGSVQKIPMAEPSPAAGPLESRTQVARPLKNPALAFSLSLLAWGGGQMYLGEKRRGAIYLIAMVSFCLGIAGFTFFGASAGRMVARHGIRPSLFLFGVAVFFLAGVVVWVINAVTAYAQAVRMRSEKFLGVENGYLSSFCSLVFPGWGQFLNGQPVKGLLFLLLAMTALFPLIVLWIARIGWPLLDADPARWVFEVYLGGSLLLLPAYCVLWIAAAYDSFRSCKVLFRKKLSFRNTGSRSAEQIRVRDLLPRTSAVLSLLLALSLGMQFLPKDYYKVSLEKIRLEMLNNHVEIIPELIHQVSGALDRLK